MCPYNFKFKKYITVIGKVEGSIKEKKRKNGFIMIQYLFQIDIKLLMVKCNIQKNKIDHRYKAFKN